VAKSESPITTNRDSILDSAGFSSVVEMGLVSLSIVGDGVGEASGLGVFGDGVGVGETLGLGVSGDGVGVGESSGLGV